MPDPDPDVLRQGVVRLDLSALCGTCTKSWLAGPDEELSPFSMQEAQFQYVTCSVQTDSGSRCKWDPLLDLHRAVYTFELCSLRAGSPSHWTLLLDNRQQLLDSYLPLLWRYQSLPSAVASDHTRSLALSGRQMQSISRSHAHELLGCG